MPANPTPDLPQWSEGDPLSAEEFNRLSDAIRQMRLSADGFNTSVGPGGTTIRPNLPKQARYAKTTSMISAMSGANLGGGSSTMTPGTIQLYYRAPGTTSLTALDTRTDILAWNITQSTIASGTFVIVERVDNDWVIVVADCSSGH